MSLCVIETAQRTTAPPQSSQGCTLQHKGAHSYGVRKHRTHTHTICLLHISAMTRVCVACAVERWHHNTNPSRLTQVYIIQCCTHMCISICECAYTSYSYGDAHSVHTRTNMRCHSAGGQPHAHPQSMDWGVEKTK